MTASSLTLLQLFGIGVGLGLTTQCLFTCAPIALSYAAAAGRGGWRAFADLAILLAGRLAAYTVLGGLAGISGSYLTAFPVSKVTAGMRILAGALIVAGGLSLAYRKDRDGAHCNNIRRDIPASAGLFLAGFAIGSVPCLPMIAVFSDILLISPNAVSGALYALAFGCGTVIVTLAIVTPLSALAGILPARLSWTAPIRKIVRIAGSAIFVAIGIRLLFTAHLT